ncbi:phenylalanine 4-monooxygenase [Sphingomonas sp. ASV193]|uniref:phenylalanine 4-monooxygenase n=1 Tax=Sphingomonas sp. ASV193 TaxID=3144405 RepID=UPI0032E903C6
MSSAAPADPGLHWSRHLVDQDWDHFTEDDHAVWDLLFDRQERTIGPRLVRAFREGLDILHLSKPGIPDLRELNEKLFAATGWRCVSVPGIIPDPDFFAMLSERHFPVGNFIRRRDQLDYLEEPDCFHDIFGHVPMLANPVMAALTEGIGRLGIEACAAGHADLASRLYWYSVEFGLAREAGELKILGAGLASSFGESVHSLDDEGVARPSFSVERAVRTPYRNDTFQPLYMVAEDLEAAMEAIRAANLAELVALAA